MQKYKDHLATVEKWHETFAECEQSALKQLGEPICDAILYPRCPLVFGDSIKEHDIKLKVFLTDHGIPVRVVVYKANKDKDVAFVYLTDAGNVFNPDLISNLNNSLAELAEKIKEQLPYEEQAPIIKQELANLYIR